MNSKSKIWQIVLLVLLLIAIAAILLFNNKLNASKETLSSTIAQLTEEQQNSAALQADLDAAKADYDDVSEQLTQEKAKTDQLNQAVEEGKAAAEQLQSDLTAATDQVAQLEGAAAESEAKIEQLEGAAAASDAMIEELKGTVAESEAKIAGLVDAAAESEKKIAGLESTVAASEEKIARLESDVAQREETIDSLNTAVTQAENKALEHQIAVAQMKLDGTLAAITGLRQKGVALPEAVSDLDAEALKDEIAAVVGAEPEAMEPAERLAALEEIREKLAGVEPEIQALVEQAGVEVETEGPETEQTEPAAEQTEPAAEQTEPAAELTKPEETAAEAEQAEAMKETMAGIEAAIVKVAGLQAAGEAVDVDLDGIRQEMADIIADSSEIMTDEARLEALTAIREKLEDALPEEAADERGEAPEETAEGDPGEDIMSAMQAQLSAAEAEVETLSTQLADQLQDIDDLHAAIAKLDAKAESDAESLSDLQDKLDAAEAEAKAQSEALAEAQKVYEKRLAEMQAYKLDHAPASGEAHLSTAVNNAIQVAADGVTASWQYANSDLSGNAATIALVLDGETIYTSGSLKPGETLQNITLNRALEPGEYQAVAVTTVFDAAGAPQLTSRVPVTLSVAAE